IGAAAADDRLAGYAADRLVAAATAADRVAGDPPDRLVAAAAADDRLVSQIAVDELVAAAAADDRDAGHAADRRVGAAADDCVAGAGPDRLITAAGADNQLIAAHCIDEQVAAVATPRSGPTERRHVGEVDRAETVYLPRLAEGEKSVGAGAGRPVADVAAAERIPVVQVVGAAVDREIGGTAGAGLTDA